MAVASTCVQQLIKSTIVVWTLLFPSSYASEAVSKFQGVCVFDVDRTLTCGNNLLEEGCPATHNCYSEQGQSAFLYQDKDGNPLGLPEIRELTARQDEHCALVAGDSNCYDRAYAWSKAWNSPKVDYPLRLSKDVQAAVDFCAGKNFAVAIATHGDADFTSGNSCPDWDPNCVVPSTCNQSKRCIVVDALNLSKMDPKLKSDCDAESDFVRHDPAQQKNVMIEEILQSLVSAARIDVSHGAFEIIMFDDEAENRKSVIDYKDKYSKLLGLPVRTCGVPAGPEWTVYQSKDEGYRGNNLAIGLDMAMAEQILQQSWENVTSTGCDGVPLKAPQSTMLKWWCWLLIAMGAAVLLGSLLTVCVWCRQRRRELPMHRVEC